MNERIIRKNNKFTNIDKEMCKNIFLDLKGNKRTRFKDIAAKYGVKYRNAMICYYARGNFKCYQKLIVTFK